MDTIPEEIIVKKAREIVAPLTNQDKKLTKKLSGNLAIITTLITIFAYVVLYSFKIGYCSVFNIPLENIQVNLKDYLPALVQISSVSIYLIWYILFIKVDIAFNRAMFQWMRICYGFLIIYLLLSANGFLKHVSGILSVIIVLSISFGIEFIVFIYFKLKYKKYENVKPEDEKKAVENAVSDLLIHNSVVRTGGFFLLIAVILAPLVGKAFAKNVSSFQLFTNNDKEYAVIIDYGDRIAAQEVHVENEILFIDISQYTCFSKEGISFKTTSFKSAVLSSCLYDDNQVKIYVPEDEDSLPPTEAKSDDLASLEQVVPQEEMSNETGNEASSQDENNN